MAQSPVGKDCNDAIELTSKSTFKAIVKEKNIGNVDDIPEGKGISCFNKRERNAFWYKFTPKNNGSFEFSLKGSNNTDWDWTLLNVEQGCNNESWQELACNSASPMECLYTGISTSEFNAWAINPCNDGNPWKPNQDLKKNTTYILMINCTDCRKDDFAEISFGGNIQF